ncbi:MAG: UDP-2,3-diacylglucosamine diphosphatase [bacterium]
MDKVYFISDAHLGAHSKTVEDKKIAKLISFFNSLQNKADYLYIVGDLYDFWFEYNRAIPKVNLRILAKLTQLVESGTEVRYLTGNHDLWHRGYLQDEIGVKIYRRPLTVRHNSLELYVAHGDGLARRNRVLRILKKILESPLNIFLYRLLHPDIGIALAMKISRTSKKRAMRRFDKDYRDFAIAKLNEGFHGVILGHTHIPLFEKIECKYYVNLGEWMQKFTYLEMIGQTLELKTWQ